MKKGILLAIMCWWVLSNSFGQSWRRVGSWGNSFSDITWINNEVGYITGENIFLKTIDGGLSWTELLVPGPNLVKMAFYDENNGILLAGSGVIYRTTNGGTSWQSRTLPGTERLSDIQYLSQNNVLITAENGALFASTNAGQTWSIRETGTTAHLKSMSFSTSQLGYMATAAAEILKTTNGGTTWQRLPIGFDVRLNSLYFTNDTIGYAVGDLGAIIKTENGGNTWQFINSGIDTDFLAVSFSRNNPLIGVVTGKNGKILRTTNGGLTFIEIVSRTVQDINALDFRQESNNIFYVANSGFLGSSTNSGASWTLRLSGRSTDYTAVQFTSDLRGYITGENGLILLTANGGSTYVDRSRPLSVAFKALHFLTAGVGYVSGANGNIISTTNSGASWTTLNPGTNRSINGVFFFDINRGYVVGERGYIATTVNRGVNWSIIASGENMLDFNAITFFEPDEGIIIGERGYISRSENGTEWSRVTLPTTASLNSITLLDDNSAIVVGNQGTIFKTTDRGRQWQRINSGIQENLTGVDFLDESVGFITGTNGLMMRTFDGGLTWEKLATGTFQNLTGISFGDLNVGYAIGEKGMLFQYTCQVPQQPTAIFGENNICLSQQLYTIQQGDEPGTTYEWRVDGGTILEGQGTNRLVVRWDIAGRNAIMVRGKNTCGNGPTSALEVVVSQQPNQAPPIQGEGVACLSAINEFYVDSVPGTEYVWAVTGGLIRGGQGSSRVDVEWTSLGNQTLRVSTSNPCGQGPVSQKTIRVLTSPARPGAITGSTRVGLQQADYEIPTVADINYQWSTGGGGTIISGQGTGRVRVSWENEGDFQLTATPMNACDSGPSQTLPVNVNLITSLPEVLTVGASFRVYPNPSQGNIKISTRGIGGLRELKIYNALGQELKDIPVVDGQEEVGIYHLPKGFLTVVLRTRTNEYAKTIWIQ
nr:T9SS type A sorting domain-containing protein [Cytophagales bacterium]